MKPESYFQCFGLKILEGKFKSQRHQNRLQHSVFSLTGLSEQTFIVYFLKLTINTSKSLWIKAIRENNI